MQDDLLRWYNTELGFLRRMGDEFAREHPKIAGRLKLGPESSQDPHVERLIEAVALMNARMRQKIDDDFPELSNAILDVLQPQFLAPIPSMMVTQFELDEGDADSTAGYSIARGTGIETEPVDGEPCRFRTGYPTTLWPVEVETASCSIRPFSAPRTPLSNEANAVIHLRLNTILPETRIDQIEWDRLRFYLNGLPQTTFGCYETLFNNVTQIAFARSADDDNPIVVKPGAIEAVGFGKDEILLPNSRHGAWQYRLLTEFFVFPQRFLFFDLCQLDLLKDAGFENELHVFLYLNNVSRDVENDVSADLFQLGCTPAINLFSQRADPIYLSQADFEYPVNGDVRRPDAVEIYSIDSVFAQTDEGEEIEFQPFYSVNHATEEEDGSYWHANRRDSRFCETDATSGSEVFVSFVDLSFETILRDGWMVDLKATCLNRDLPERLPYGGGQPALFLADEAGSVSKVRAMTALTPTIRPQLEDGARWKLISHLGIDHLSIVGGEDAAETLREVLATYDFEETNATRSLIHSILKVDSRRVTRRIYDAGFAGVCRGIETTIVFDKQVQEPKLFLLACVLEQFLGQTCSINSFSQLIVRLDKEDVVWKNWPPRTGDRILL